jgi:hypothetical protein
VYRDRGARSSTTPVDTALSANSASQTTVPAELQELALELALAMHARAMYPVGHPLLQAAVDRLCGRVQKALATRGDISLGIAHHQVVIEGVATDDKHPLLRAFALHLHQHQIAALRISAGVEPAEVEDFLSTLSLPASRAEQPLGLLGPEVLQRWQHVALFPAVFDKLELIDDADSEDGAMAQSRAAQLWLGLARAAISGDLDGEDNYEPSRVARAIDSHRRERAYDDVIVGHLLQMSTEMTASASPSSRVLRERLSTMVRGLRPKTLSRLLEMGGDLVQRKRFVMFSADALSTGAVLDIFNAAGNASGHPVAKAMTHLLAKLAQNADSKKEFAPGADQDLRRHVKNLVTDWTIADPNPEEYNHTLSEVSSVSLGDRIDEHREEVEPERLLEISLSADASGPDTNVAVKRLISREGLSAVVERVLAASPSLTRETLLDGLLNLSMLQEHLQAERPDLRSLKHAVARLQAQALDPLVAALETRAERDASWLAELIVLIGDKAAPSLGAAFSRLKPSSRRALLPVFEQWNVWPEEVNLLALATNSDPQIRRDAVRLLLKSDDTRAEGVIIGLRDDDERVFRLVLFATMRGATAETAYALIHRAEDARLSEELRARTIRALAATGRPEAMRWLVDHSSVASRGFLGLSRGGRLRRKSATTVAAIAGLAAHWSQAPEAAAVLELAASSKDEELRNAATLYLESL